MLRFCRIDARLTAHPPAPRPGPVPTCPDRAFLTVAIARELHRGDLRTARPAAAGAGVPAAVSRLAGTSGTEPAHALAVGALDGLPPRRAAAGACSRAGRRSSCAACVPASRICSTNSRTAFTWDTTAPTRSGGCSPAWPPRWPPSPSSPPGAAGVSGSSDPTAAVNTRGSAILGGEPRAIGLAVPEQVRAPWMRSGRVTADLQDGAGEVRA
jgi:hypothetical protein